MLHAFLTSNHEELIKRCREKATQRFEPAKVSEAIDHGVPLFLKQLGDTLRREQATPSRADTKPEETPSPEIGRDAALHGVELMRLGYSIDQVVREYGDICQSVTAIAVEQNAEITADEFRTLNRCLDDAIADAVTSFARGRQVSINDEARTVADRLTAFLEEHRQLVDIATQSYAAIRTGNVGVGGATGTLLLHTLSELSFLGEEGLSEGPATASSMSKGS